MVEQEMSYIDRIAWKVWEASGHGENAPDGMWMLYRIYAVLVLAKGEETTMKDVHDAWSAFVASREPEHRSLIPFEDLTVKIQEYDRPYMEAIHAVARELGGYEG